MLGYIVGFLLVSFYAYQYIQTRYVRYLWATLFVLIVIGFKVLFDFFVPASTFYSWLGWLIIPFIIIMMLGALSTILICFMPRNKRDETAKG